MFALSESFQYRGYWEEDPWHTSEVGTIQEAYFSYVRSKKMPETSAMKSVALKSLARASEWAYLSWWDQRNKPVMGCFLI